MAEAISDESGQMEQAGEIEEKNIVSAFDPDFLLFALPFAFTFDALDVVLEIFSEIVIPKLIGIGIDAFVFIVLALWIYKRTKRELMRREEQKQALQQKMRAGAKKLDQQLAKGVAKRASRKALTKAAVVLIGELIPFVGIIPFWTISVISTLREK